MIHMEKLCPHFEKATHLISKRWVCLVLYELMSGTKRFSEMETNLPISGRLLSERLKFLEKEDIIIRHVYSEYPIRIEYKLTSKGVALKPVIEEIMKWSYEWLREREAETVQQ